MRTLMSCLLRPYFDRNGHNSEVCTLDRIWEIRKLVNIRSQDYILLAHAFLGCDTTFWIYWLGKDRVMKTDKMKEACKHAFLVFYDSSSKKEDIQKVGEKFLLTILGRSKNISLDEAWAKVLMEEINGKQVVKPKRLPPTGHCACFHFYSVYCQFQQWLGNLVLPHE